MTKIKFHGPGIGTLDSRYLKLTADNDPITGDLLLKPISDSTTTLQVQQADTTVVFNVDTTNKRVGVGIAAPEGEFHISGTGQQDLILEATNDVASFRFDSYRSVASSHAVFVARAARGTKASPLAIAGDDSILRISAQGWDGDSWNGAATIQIFADDTVSTSQVPGHIRFSTAETSAVVERMRISKTGQVGIGGGATINARFHVTGINNIVQTIIQANSTQGANIVEIQDDEANVLSGVDERGILFSDGGIDANSVYIGSNAGNISHTDAIQNIGIGRNALRFLTTADNNVLIGAFSGDAITVGGSNMGIGTFSLSNVTEGNSNAGIGTNTLLDVITGDHNVAIGQNAMRSVDSDASNNVAIGSNAGKNANDDNIFIGSYAGFRQTGSNLFMVDSQRSERADIATELTNSILYGVMASTPASQSLRVNANLTTTQGRIKNTTRQTTTYTILVTDDVVFGNTDSAGWTATLPALSEGQTFRIINTGTSGNTLTIAPDGSDNLLGANNSFNLADGEALLLTASETDGWF